MRNDILLRRGILKDSGIQYLEYLESTGTQYIDTGILTNDKLVIKLKIHVLGGVGGAFGYRWNGGVGDSNQLIVSSNGENVCIAYGLSAIYAKYNKNIIYNIEFNPVTKNVWVNGALDKNSRNISLAYNNSSSVFNVTLFGANLKGTMNIILSRIYSYSVYEEGECIIDLVPISIGGVGYMLDKVTNKVFSNAGTGDFILGPILPDFKLSTKIEYLQSDGKPFIDTMINGGDDELEIKIKFMYSSFTAYAGIYGNQDPTIAYNVTQLLLSNKDNMCTGGINILSGGGNTSVNAPRNQIINHIANQKKIIVNDIEVNVINIKHGLVNTDSILLFKKYKSNILNIGLKIYSFSISKNGIMLRDMIPVRINDTGYMYDKISNQLFENKGSGKFILGPDI